MEPLVALKHISLFTGIGGFDLAAEWMGWENVAHCEIDPFCRRLLKYYWKNSISYEDIKKTDFTIWRRRIDILTGGFPCQPFSTAGHRKGTDDDRYLWDEYLRAIREIQPRFVVAENVTGILSMEEREMFTRVDSRKRVRFDYIDEYEAIYTRQAKMLLNSICEDLEKEGYSVQPIIIPAAGINAPHRRDRIWIVAHSCKKRHSFRRNLYRKDRSQESARKKIGEEWERFRNGIRRNDDTGATANSTGKRLKTRIEKGVRTIEKKNKTGMEFRNKRFGSDATTTDPHQFNGNISGFRTGEISQFKASKVFKYIASYPNCIRQSGKEYRKNESGQFDKTSIPTYWENFPTQPPVCDGNDGFSSKLDGITFSNWRNESIRAGGNAIVPQVAYEIFQAIEQYRKTT